MMLDLVRLYVKAGDGGNGRVAFWRNRSVLKGGPVGGDGGDGGDVWLRVDENLNTLQHFAGRKKVIAGDGQRGGKARQVGKKGDIEEILVPAGTVVWLYSENQVSQLRRERYGLSKKLARDEVAHPKYTVEKETNSPPPREKDEIEADARPDFGEFLHRRVSGEEAEYLPIPEGELVQIAKMEANDRPIVLCQGGFGGRGNDTFKSSRQTTPMMAEYGTFGEQKMVFLELRLLANIGLVGLPNAGKSTLLSVLTKAKPKVADYPFTTLEPHLGVMEIDDGDGLVIADIPGLIEGASVGKGLGFDFLRHVANCRELVMVLSLSEEQVFSDKSDEEKAKLLVEQLEILEKEVEGYGVELAEKRREVLVNKIDIYPASLRQAIEKLALQRREKWWLVSAATGEGLREWRDSLIGENKQ